METTATVLLVDDDSGLVDTAAAFVERANEALTTTTATNPEAALDRFEEGDIDCIVSDYNMPEMDGLALFEAVSERDGETPFILFTGKGSEEVAGEAISLGVTDYLQKETGTEQYEVLANRIENAVEAQRAEQRLDRYRMMVETVDDALYTVDSEGRFTSVNDSFVNLTGYDRTELVGSDVSILKGEATVERFEEEVREMLRGDRDETYIEFDLQTAAGDTIPCEDHMALRTDEGEYAGVAGVIRGVSARERRERDLERERERFITLFENIPDPAVCVDASAEAGTIRAVNEAFEDTFGYAEETVVDGTLNEFIVPPERTDEAERIDRAILDGEQVIRELDRRTADGDRRDFLFRTAMIDEESSEVFGIYTDITEQRERERELERYETAIEAAPVSVFVLDADGTIVWCNDRAAASVGHTATALIGEPFVSLVEEGTVPEEGVADYEAVLRDLLSSETDRTAGEYELTVTPPGESERTLRVQVSPLPYDEEFRGAVLVSEDVTERKRRERDLERERERFATLFENIPDPSVLVELDGDESVVESINEAFEDTFGYAAEAAVGESLNDLIVPPAAMEEATALDRAAMDGERIVAEVTRRTADGERREFLFSNATIDGDADVAFGVYTDITEQKRREQVLVDLHDRTRAMMATEDPDAVASIAVETAESVLEFPLCGLWLADDETEHLVPAATTEAANATVNTIPTYEPGNSLSWDAFADGETRIYEDVHKVDAYDSGSPLRSEMILPLGEFGVMNVGSTTVGGFDDTDEALAHLLATNAEAALERAEREQERAAQKRLLERQNERLEEFASVVSHDLRNPLTVASGRLDLLAEDCDSPHVQLIDEALARMDELIEECLTFARQGQVVIDPSRVDLDHCVERAWQTVDTGDANLRVGDLGSVEADDERLRTLFENLFRNAIEHGDATTVRVGPLDDRTGFYVADDGSGIPDGERDAVFDRGYSTNEDGTGLGLAIVHTLADAHGWDIDLAEATPGARFEVTVEPTALLVAPQPGG